MAFSLRAAMAVLGCWPAPLLTEQWACRRRVFALKALRPNSRRGRRWRRHDSAALAGGLPAAANAQGQLLRNAVAIDDEFRGYCIDVYGGGANARVDEALRVHSCKTDRYRGMNGDQLFQWVDDFMGRVTMPEYNRCMEATAIAAGGRPGQRACVDLARLPGSRDRDRREHRLRICLRSMRPHK